MRREHVVISAGIVLSTLFTAAAWHLYYENYFTGLILNDAMDYAGIARNVALGQGFISQYITPLSLAHYGVPQPDMWRAPLWPLALAVFQKAMGFSDEASAVGAGFFFIAASPVVFLLARQWFGSLVAAGSVLVYSLTPELLRYSISGMTETMAVFLMSLAMLATSTKSLKNSPGDWLSGAVLGLFYLARYNALVFLPFFLLFRWHYRRQGLLPPARFLAAFTLVALPWLARNTVLFGNPLFSLQKYEPVMFTRIYPDYSLYLYAIKIDVIELFKSHPDALLEKISAGWEHYTSIFLNPSLNGVSAALFVLFLVSVILPLNKNTAGIRPLILACYITQLSALLVIHFIPRLFLVFTPFYTIFALGALQMLVGATAKKLRLRYIPGLLATILIIFLSFYNFVSPGPPAREVPDRDAYLKTARELFKKVPADKVILTDMGHVISWYGERYACKIPYSVEMIPEIKKRADIGAIFISDRILWHMPEADRSWKQLWYHRPPELHGFKLYKVIKGKGFIYLTPDLYAQAMLSEAN
ncbi:MAG: ArnT family glycosyltransferase [Bacillota bacterium]